VPGKPVARVFTVHEGRNLGSAIVGIFTELFLQHLSDCSRGKRLFYFILFSRRLTKPYSIFVTMMFYGLAGKYMYQTLLSSHFCHMLRRKTSLIVVLHSPVSCSL